MHIDNKPPSSVEAGESKPRRAKRTIKTMAPAIAAQHVARAARLVEEMRKGLSIREAAKAAGIPLHKARYSIEVVGLRVSELERDKQPKVAPASPSPIPALPPQPPRPTGLLAPRYFEPAERKAMDDRASAHRARMEKETRKPTEAELRAMIDAAVASGRVTKCPPGAAGEMLSNDEAFRSFYYGAGVSKPK